MSKAPMNHPWAIIPDLGVNKLNAFLLSADTDYLTCNKIGKFKNLLNIKLSVPGYPDINGPLTNSSESIYIILLIQSQF